MEKRKDVQVANLNELGFLDKLSNWYFKKEALPYWAIFLVDCAILFIVYISVYLLFRPSLFYWASWGLGRDFLSLLGWVSLRIFFFMLFYVIGMRVFKTYAGIIRYSSFTDLLRVGSAMLLGGVASWLAHYPAFEYFSFYVHDFEANIRSRDIVAATLIATFLMWLMRMLIKAMYDTTFAREASQAAFIYGVREGGIGLAKSIRNEKPTRFVLKGFVAPNAGYTGTVLMGRKVYQADDTLVPAMRKKKAKAMLVSALAANEFRKNTALQDALLAAGIRIYMVPHVQEITASAAKGSLGASLREVQIEDLLPRDEIKVDLKSVEALLKGKRVLITGSAGSIGSELVRQIAKFGPAEMMLIDQAETPQHDIRLMMAREFPQVKALTVVTSICKAARMESIFSSFRPDYVFHAAAYKHVPMMEDNPSEGVENNIVGTRVVADLSVKYQVEKFVMVSTDKAVNPTNVMGCSKRICEIYVQSLDKAIKEGRVQGVTQFVTTRFGNVLGSNGSVIPLFRRQIKAGGPVTVTHPDIYRYFMLIPEACQLVLEAGTMGHGGEIFVFDMGQPVRIADLAQRMIKLSGAEGVEIKFTGLRDGEKLYEEVLDDEETTKPTFNEKIKIAGVREYDYDTVCRQVDQLEQVSRQFDDMATVRLMKQMVPEYKSRHSIYEALDKA